MRRSTGLEFPLLAAVRFDGVDLVLAAEVDCAVSVNGGRLLDDAAGRELPLLGAVRFVSVELPVSATEIDRAVLGEEHLSLRRVVTELHDAPLPIGGQVQASEVASAVISDR